MSRSRHLYINGYRAITSLFPTNMAFPVYATVLIISSTISAVLACNGYQVTKLDITPCDQGKVLKFDNFNVKLTDDCKAVPSGCINILKTVTGGEGSYQVKKLAKIGPPLTFGGKKEICSLLESSKNNGEIELVFKLLQMDQKCPVAGKNMCPKGGMDISKYKDKLKMLEGDSTVDIKGKTTDGDEVCTHIELTISKAGGGAPGIMG